MTDSSVDGMDYRVIVVRFDPDNGRVIVDPGDCELYAAVTILQKACDRVYEEIADALFIDEDPDAEDDEDDDDND